MDEKDVDISVDDNVLSIRGEKRSETEDKERGYSEARRALAFYGRLAGLLGQHRYDAAFAHMIEVFALLGAPPAELGLDPFYKKYADAFGIPIVSSERVADTALLLEVIAGEDGLDPRQYGVRTEAYTKALTDHKLEPVSEPEVDEKAADLEELAVHRALMRTKLLTFAPPNQQTDAAPAAQGSKGGH